MQHRQGGRARRLGSAGETTHVVGPCRVHFVALAWKRELLRHERAPIGWALAGEGWHSGIRQPPIARTYAHGRGNFASALGAQVLVRMAVPPLAQAYAFPCIAAVVAAHRRPSE